MRTLRSTFGAAFGNSAGLVSAMSAVLTASCIWPAVVSTPLLSEARVRLLGVVEPEQLSAIEQLARHVNDVLRPFFADLDLQLVDFKLELGFNAEGQLLLADEISPDTCRFWDRRNSNTEDRILDKDRFRKDLGGVMEAYGEVLKRVQGNCPNPRDCL